ncbi:hypothetical protein ACLKA7_010346 [Drosophila subpalustris]
MIRLSAYEIRKSSTAHASTLSPKLRYQTLTLSSCETVREHQGLWAVWARHGAWSMPCQQARDTRHKLPSPDLPVDKEYQAPDELRKLAVAIPPFHRH